MHWQCVIINFLAFIHRTRAWYNSVAHRHLGDVIIIIIIIIIILNFINIIIIIIIIIKNEKIRMTLCENAAGALHSQ